MELLKLTITMITPFATLLKGDTLFGQACWAIREIYGNAALTNMLSKYNADQPMLVCSDAFPAGYLPRPKAPASMLGFASGRIEQRKQDKRKIWMPFAKLGAALGDWQKHLVDNQQANHETENWNQPHNTINRLTSATGTGQFAPYSTALWQVNSSQSLDIYVLFDRESISKEQVTTVFQHMGNTGYGKKATSGLGKFELLSCVTLPTNNEATRWLTLAPSLPNEKWLDTAQCFYQPFTRFGRHGGFITHTGNVYKTPITFIDSGALITAQSPQTKAYIGQGLGGDGEISSTLPETVAQAYSPIMAIGE